MKTTEKPRLLCVGHDGLLNRTRQLILQREFDVSQAEDLSKATAMLRDRRFALILLCYSLTDEESRAMVQLVHGLSPETKILALGEEREQLSMRVRDEFFQPNGPEDLLKKASKMVATAVHASVPARGSRSLSGCGGDSGSRVNETDSGQ